MIAGAKYRGEFEERSKSVLEEIKPGRTDVTFIDEIHTVVGAGRPKAPWMQAICSSQCSPAVNCV